MPLMFLYAFGILFVYFTLGFLVAQYKKNNALVDIMWGAGFVLLAFALLFIYRISGEVGSWGQFYIVLFMTIWGIRLTYFLYKRNKNKPEDDRYQALRNRWGDKVGINAFFKIFMGQMLAQYAIALPVILVFAYPMENGSPLLSTILFIAVILWIFGFTYEVIADQQMRNFKKRPEMDGRILKTGLWRYSRHPNYFGEAVLWWGIGLIALASTSFPLSLIALVSPLTITLSLRYVTGVPPLEKKLMHREEFKRYASKTSVMIPRKPKK